MLRLRTIFVLTIGFLAGYLVASGRGKELLERGRTAFGQVADDSGLTDAGRRVGEGAARQMGEQVRDVVDRVADHLEGVADEVDSPATGTKSTAAKSATAHKSTGTATKAKSSEHS